MLDDPLLTGIDRVPALVAAEHQEADGRPDVMVLYWRREGITVRSLERFTPFLLVAAKDLLDGPLRPAALTRLNGDGDLCWRADFDTWKSCLKAKAWLTRRTGIPVGSPEAPYYLIADPVQQYLMQSGRTLFKGMRFDDVRRMQVDIECYTSEGFEFCNAQREGDRIIAVAMADSTGWNRVLSGAEMGERDLLETFTATVRERDPDVLEGHNIFNFDLPYLTARASRLKVPLALGRDGSVPVVRASRFAAGERTIPYTRFSVFGRHIVDTLFLVQTYDVVHRSLEGYGLKEVTRHFGIACDDRVYLEGTEIASEFRANPAAVMRYAGHDAVETCALSRLLAPSAFVQAQLVPMSYQSVCVRGNAGKIDALMLREYLRQGYAVPLPDRTRPFSGGYTDMFRTGVVRGVHHCDVRSLYPSLMLARRIRPKHDVLDVFLRLLVGLRRFRLEARDAARRATSAGERTHLDALQTTFKVLINSFYGYLGFDQARFSDFDAAEQVTAQGRGLLQAMIDWLRAHGAEPVEIDTDGIYFVPPVPAVGGTQTAFREAFQASLPEGIEVDFDGEYLAMFSYKMKNYALLAPGGTIIIKGAALKSRGLEPFQREFLRDMIRLKLEGREDELPALKESFDQRIRERAWPVARFAKTETLQDAPATYAAKVGRSSRGRSAAYELALRSGRDYRAGDQVSYYVTGSRKSVPVHAAAKLVSAWNPFERDENVAYYVAKLDALYERFCGGKLGAAEEE